MRVLHDAGADFDATDDLHRTPLHLAVQHATPRVAVELARARAREGADLEARDQHGRTALVRAGKASRGDLIEQLLELGADRNATDHHGHSASTIAR